MPFPFTNCPICGTPLEFGYCFTCGFDVYTDTFSAPGFEGLEDPASGGDDPSSDYMLDDILSDFID